MSLQGVSWLVRKAICLASITISIRQEGVGRATAITIHNMANFGVQGTTEVRKLDWEFTAHKDHVWGHVRGRSKFVPAIDRPVGFSGANAPNDAQNEHSELLYNEIQAVDGSWKSQMVCHTVTLPMHDTNYLFMQLWAFEIVEGSRYFVRHVKASRGSEQAVARLVYNYLA